MKCFAPVFWCHFEYKIILYYLSHLHSLLLINIFAVSPQVIGIEKIIKHPQYSRSPLKNDIALIKLTRPARLNSRVQTICLPTRNSKPAIGSKECYLSGKSFSFIALLIVRQSWGCYLYLILDPTVRLTLLTLIDPAEGKWL